MTAITKQERFQRRKHRTKVRLEVALSRPRLSVHKTNLHIYAQLINDAKQETIVSFSDSLITTLAPEQVQALAKQEEVIKTLTTGRQKAYKVGFVTGMLALKKDVKEIVFDRSGYRYHGLVAALAEGARAAGLIF